MSRLRPGLAPVVSLALHSLVQGIQSGPGGHGLSEAASQVAEGLACAAGGGLRGVYSAGSAPGCDRGMVWQVSAQEDLKVPSGRKPGNTVRELRRVLHCACWHHRQSIG